MRAAVSINSGGESGAAEPGPSVGRRAGELEVEKRARVGVDKACPVSLPASRDTSKSSGEMGARLTGALVGGADVTSGRSSSTGGRRISLETCRAPGSPAAVCKGVTGVAVIRPSRVRETLGTMVEPPAFRVRRERARLRPLCRPPVDARLGDPGCEEPLSKSNERVEVGVATRSTGAAAGAGSAAEAAEAAGVAGPI